MRRSKPPIVSTLALLLAAFSCTPRPGGTGGGLPAALSPRGSQAQGPPRPGEHWSLYERLHVLAGRISDDRSSPAGVDAEGSTSGPAARGDATGNDTFREAAALADGLAEAAARIPRSVADYPMSEEDRRGFGAEAERLRRQALDARQIARGRGTGPLRPVVDRIRPTCVACHTQYREFAGDLTRQGLGKP